MTKISLTNVFQLTLLTFVLTLLFNGLSVRAEVLGCNEISSAYNSFYETIKFVVPIVGVLFIGWKGLAVLSDSENAKIKSEFISSLIWAAVAIIVVFAAPSLIEQFGRITGQTITLGQCKK
jgi:Type IV secretion system pilin